MPSHKRLAATIIAFLAISITLLCYRQPGNVIRRSQLKPSLVVSPDVDAQAQGRVPLADGPPIASTGNYSVELVLGKLSHQDTSWLNHLEPSYSPTIYTIDDPHADNILPTNKGNEVMTYLTYIITHYDRLSDVSIFIHPHRYAWHNNDLLDNDMVEMLAHLRLDKVHMEGYLNLRCQWGPGCPHWLRPQEGVHGAKMNKQEQLHIAKVWKELFPLSLLPEGLSGPCCGQFAVTREAIQRLPLQSYAEMRNWLISTELSDYIVGRCFEHLWQYIFSGQEEVCPDQHVCHCEGYGFCFESDAEFQKWFEIRYWAKEKTKELDAWDHAMAEWQESHVNGTWDELPESDRPAKPSEALGHELGEALEEMQRDMTLRKDAAKRRGSVVQAQPKAIG